MGWKQLGAIWRDNQAEHEAEAELPPEECPYDGTPLRVKGRVRWCPMGDYKWEG